MTKKAAIYARVNQPKPVDCNYSLSSQIAACKEFARQKGFKVVGIYQDEISGKKPMTSRLGGGKLSRAFSRGQIDVVIVNSIDRLSRDVVDVLATIQDWSKAGVEIYALDVGPLTNELSENGKLPIKEKGKKS